jgi:hypothetical protein
MHANCPKAATDPSGGYSSAADPSGGCSSAASIAAWRNLAELVLGLGSLVGNRRDHGGPGRKAPSAGSLGNPGPQGNHRECLEDRNPRVFRFSETQWDMEGEPFRDQGRMATIRSPRSTGGGEPLMAIAREPKAHGGKQTLPNKTNEGPVNSHTTACSEDVIAQHRLRGVQYWSDMTQEEHSNWGVLGLDQRSWDLWHAYDCDAYKL